METNTLPLELPIGIGANQRVESGNSSDNQGHSNSSSILGPEIREDDYAAFVEAVRRGDWQTTRDFLELHPHALTARITGELMGGTVLHVAVDAEHEHIVEELVNMISEHDLAKQDYDGNTALHLASISGNYRMAECLITKNRSLVGIRSFENQLPVTLAMANGRKILARYLYSQTPLDDLVADEGSFGASLLNSSIYNRDLGIHVDISCVRAADQFRLNIMQNNGQEKAIGSVRADLWRQLVASLLNLLGFKRLYEMKLARTQFQLLLSLMFKSVTTFDSSSRDRYLTIFVHIIKENPHILLTSENSYRSRTIFHWAVLHREHRIFNLIYSLKRKNDLLNKVDYDGNTILHMAGMLIENTPIDSIRGAAFQLQRELQWFKEVECICPLSHKEIINRDGLTARQLFNNDHQEMRKEGERWMKDTATSCTVMGTLIITIMFTAAFTIPGGNN